MSIAALIGIKVSRHAMQRAAERFPAFDALLIEDEVREALREGRVSAHKPRGINGPPDPLSLYLWTADGGRVYAVHHGKQCFYVMTTMRAEAA